MNKLDKLGIISFAKFQAFMAGLIGLLFGVIYSFGGLIIDTAVTLGWLSAEVMETPGLSYGTVLAFGALVGMPLIGVVGGFFAGIVGAVLYNFIIKATGAMNIDFH